VAYIDSRGVAMDDMPFSEALDMVHALAGSNLPDEHDIAGEAALAAERDWQRVALDTVADLVTNHHEAIDDEFSPPAEYGEWPTEAVQADRSDDPEDPVSAIRIVLDMARNALPDPMTVSGVEDAEKFDRDNQAVELVEDLVCLHGAALSEKVRVIRLPTVN
jgi:hypothetical protein